MEGRVVQVNRKAQTAGEHGLPKAPADEVRITAHGLAGDFNRYRHDARADDPGRAVMLLPLETLRALNDEGWPVQPGDMGENLLTEGIAYDDFHVGAQVQVGETLLEVAEPCVACRNLAALPYVGDERVAAFIRTLTHMEGGALVNRRGWYAAVLREGVVRPGDAVTVT